MNQCEIKIDCLNVVNYAIQQNRLPFMRSIQLFNGTDCTLDHCSVHLSFFPEFAQEMDIHWVNSSPVRE